MNFRTTRPHEAAGSLDDLIAGDPVMAGLVARVIARLERGERVIPEEYTESHPECVAPLRRLLPVLRAMAELGRARRPLDRRPEV